MRRSVYERLDRDIAEARRAALAAERKEHEFARMRCEHASMRVDLALIRLQHVLAKEYNPKQPRVPAGQPGGGQWTDGDDSGINPDDIVNPQWASGKPDARVILAGGIKPEDHGLTVEQFLSRYCLGSAGREIPGQFKQMTVGEMLAAKQAGNHAAAKCYKLLNEDRFRK